LWELFVKVTVGLKPLEEVDLQDAEDTLVSRPHGGTVDKVVSAQMVKAGRSYEQICRYFGYDPFLPCRLTPAEEIQMATDAVNLLWNKFPTIRCYQNAAATDFVEQVVAHN
jgi:hypothetical protein